MKIGLLQLNPVWENVEENKEKLSILIEKNNTSELDLLVLPEMSLTGFTMNSSVFAEELDGASTLFFINLARHFKINIIAGLIERDGDRIFNSAVHFDRQGIIAARYRKIHRFSFAKENQYYSPAEIPVLTKIDNHTFGISICYDLRFPELYRSYGKHKVSGLINIANWPIQRIDHWNHLLKARAIENLCFMIGVNRCGNDPFNPYNGRSAVYDPTGKEIIICNEDENLFTVEIDLNLTVLTREKFNFLDDIKLI